MAIPRTTASRSRRTDWPIIDRQQVLESMNARNHRLRLDSLLVALIFVVLSLLSGRVFRSAFDDEIFSLKLIGTARSLSQLWLELLHAVDVHPPVSYLVFYGVSHLGVGERGLRLTSLVISALAAVLAHRILCLMLPEEQRLSVPDRVIPIIVLASTPLLVSQGDAIRWYPIFALIFFLTLYAYLREPRGIYSAALCGLLASTSFLGFLVYPLLELDRISKCGIRAYWSPAAAVRAALFAIFALPGLITLWNGLTHDAPKYLAGQVGANPLTAGITTAMGFFGGNSLGIVQSIAALPAGALAIFILYRSVRDPGSRALALNFSTLFLLVAVGFSKPRSFIYLALILSVLVSYRWIVDPRPNIRYLIGLIALATPLIVIANVKWNETPYKRNAVLPVEEILRFARYNAQAGDVIVVSDPVVYWDLHGDVPACVTLYLTNSACAINRANKLIVIDGYGIGSEDRDEWLERKGEILAGRSELATVFFGIDHEAGLKRRIIPAMDDYILQASIYARAPSP